MAQIVAVHGIAQEYGGPYQTAANWWPALRDGVHNAGQVLPDNIDLTAAYWSLLFRPEGTMSAGAPPYTAMDLNEEFEETLLMKWWEDAAAADPAVPGPEAEAMGRTPRLVQRALLQLSSSRYFARVAERVLIGWIKQVHDYLTKQDVRDQVRQKVVQAVGPDTRIVIGHSLGSVVAYEALAAHPEWEVHTFITLGSPLGIPNLIFDRLDPTPNAGLGAWPGSVKDWTNVADGGDHVALAKRLNPLFDGQVRDVLVHNGAQAHDIRPYLSASETGRAIAAAFRD